MTDPLSPQPARTLGDRYELQQVLGSGGNGEVWCAYDRKLRRAVAVKLLSGQLAGDPHATARLRAEGAGAAMLNHHHAVTIYDIGREHDRDYLVMELVEGGTLADVLQFAPVPPEAVAALGDQIGRALGAAHDRGLVHRDVTPGNVLLSPEGVVKVADFGIARSLDEATSRLTAPGQVIGTARYLAPEQLRDETVDARADVYALGLLLYQLLTARPPFGDGTPTEVAMRRLADRLPRPSEHRSRIPPELDDAVARATEPAPGDRFADGSELAAALAGLASTSAVQALVGGLPGTREDADHRPAGADDGPTAASVNDGPTAALGAAAADATAPNPVREPAPSSAAEEPAGESHPTSRRRQVSAKSVALLAALLAAVGVGALIGFGSEETDRPVADEPDAEASSADQDDDPPTPLEIVDAGEHDPFGDGSEHPEDVAHLLDGDTATAWRTHAYYGDPALGGLKSGVGVWLDLGESHRVSEVTVATSPPGGSFTLFAGGAPPPSGAAPSQWGQEAATVDRATGTTRVELDDVTDGRVWLVWFTSLPADGGEFRATVSDVRFEAS